VQTQIRIAAIQQGPRGEDPKWNLADLLKSIDATASGGVDYIVATELSLTPYFCGEPTHAYQKWAEATDGEATAAVAAKAREHRATIIFPFFRRDEEKGKYYNSAVVIGPDGSLVEGELPGGRRVRHFDKAHLPKIHAETLVTDEQYHFEPGEGFPLFNMSNARVGMLICYDRRFPEAWRTLALGGAEIVFLPACVPAWETASAASSAEMFVAELRTRALENLFYVVACNRAGFETVAGNKTLFFGESCVIGPGGTVLARGLANAPCVVRATIDLAEVARMRQRLPLLSERRGELYLR
jgi:N-carbamoylputrescine amidase